MIWPTVLALHKASPETPAGTFEIGLVTLAEFEGPGGALVSVSGPG